MKEVVKKAKSASAPGPKRLLYKLYKNCPRLTKVLWKLMKAVWKKQVPAKWQQAVGMFFPEEQNSHTITQFRSIALVNVEGKIFFSILSMTTFLSLNGYIDTSCQKAGIPGFPVASSTHLSSRIRSCVQRDLANAYGSVPHKLVDFALRAFHVPGCIQDIIGRYFSNLHMCFTLKDYTTEWQRLEYGIIIGCAISPVLFIIAIEVILRGARQVVGAIKLASGLDKKPLLSLGRQYAAD